MERMIKAITIWQPYASLLVAQQHKHFETRGWATNYTGPIAIHAAKRPIEQTLAELDEETRARILGLYGREYLEQLPIGAIIGIGRLERCNEVTEDFVAALPPMERCLGDYTLGRFAWEFSSMTPIGPIPASGKQGLWSWDGLERKTMI